MRGGRGLDDVAQIGALPVPPRELIVSLAERNQAALESLAERLGRIGAARRLRRQRLHRRQRILDAVIEFAPDIFDQPVPALLRTRVCNLPLFQIAA